MDDFLIRGLNYYVSLLLFDLNELESCSFQFIDNKSFQLRIVAFNDNIEKYFNRTIEIIYEEPKGENFNLLKEYLFSLLDGEKQKEMNAYTMELLQKFLKGGKDTIDIDQIKKIINSIDIKIFKNIQNEICNNIEKLNLKVAGNLNDELNSKL